MNRRLPATSIAPVAERRSVRSRGWLAGVAILALAAIVLSRVERVRLIRAMVTGVKQPL